MTAKERRLRLEEEAAQDYAAQIRAMDQIRPDWTARNVDIIDRFGMAGLRRIKARAWRIVTEEPR